MMCFVHSAVRPDVGSARAAREVYCWGSLITGLSALPAFWIWMNYPRRADAGLDRPDRAVRRSSMRRSTARRPRCSAICSEPQVRYTGISFVYQFSGIFASGLTPIIATALVQAYGINGGWAIALYCIFAGAVAIR